MHVRWLDGKIRRYVRYGPKVASAKTDGIVFVKTFDSTICID